MNSLIRCFGQNTSCNSWLYKEKSLVTTKAILALCLALKQFLLELALSSLGFKKTVGGQKSLSEEPENSLIEVV